VGRRWAEEREVKNIFDLWRENGCKVPFRAQRGWGGKYWVTVIAVFPSGKYGEAVGYGNVEHGAGQDRSYWGTKSAPVRIGNAGCYGWSMVTDEEG
jgi:hypothetical protein